MGFKKKFLYEFPCAPHFILLSNIAIIFAYSFNQFSYIFQITNRNLMFYVLMIYCVHILLWFNMRWTHFVIQNLPSLGSNEPTYTWDHPKYVYRNSSDHVINLGARWATISPRSCSSSPPWLSTSGGYTPRQPESSQTLQKRLYFRKTPLTFDTWPEHPRAIQNGDRISKYKTPVLQNRRE